MEDMAVESVKCGYGGGVVHIFRDFALLGGCPVNFNSTGDNVDGPAFKRRREARLSRFA